MLRFWMHWRQSRPRTTVRQFSRAIGHIYNPWLRDLAEQFQERFKTKPLPGREVTRLQEAHPGTVILFADGLRFDVGQKLKALLEAKGLTVQLRHHTVALPR